MGLFVWTYRSGVEFHTEPAGFRLMIERAASGTGYRYQVFGRAGGPAEPGLLASGARESLREAIDAAEAATTSIDPALLADRPAPTQAAPELSP